MRHIKDILVAFLVLISSFISWGMEHTEGAHIAPAFSEAPCLDEINSHSISLYEAPTPVPTPAENMLRDLLIDGMTCSISPNFLSRYDESIIHKRSQLLGIMLRFTLRTRSNTHIFFLAVNYLDRFLATDFLPDDSSGIDFLATACWWIAFKLDHDEDPDPIHLFLSPLFD